MTIVAEAKRSRYDDTPLETPSAGDDARFPLLAGETLSGGLKRVLLGEIVGARAALADGTISREEAVHRVRRRLKRARAVFSVVEEVPGADREHRTARVRDIGRLLAGARDADVVAREARRVLARAEGRTVAAAGVLVERLETAQQAAHAVLPPLDEVAARLRAAEADARSLPDRFEAGRLLADAIVAAYRRGRRDWRDLCDGASVEAMHDWRKRVKRRRHLSALVPIDTPLTTRALQRDLDDLGEILGEEHDLALLAARLDEDQALLRPREGRDGVVDLIERRRRRLAKKAVELGEELYGARSRDAAAVLEPLRELC